MEAPLPISAPLSPPPRWPWAALLAGGLTLAACYLLPVIQSFAALAAAFAGPAR